MKNYKREIECAFDLLTDKEQRCQLHEMLYFYEYKGIILSTDDPVLNMAFSLIRLSMDDDRATEHLEQERLIIEQEQIAAEQEAAHEELIEKRRAAGRMGGRPRKGQESTEKQKKQKKQIVFLLFSGEKEPCELIDNQEEKAKKANANFAFQEKENEKEKESTPHTPLIGKEKDKEKEMFGARENFDGDKSPTNAQPVANEEGEIITTQIIKPTKPPICTIEQRSKKFYDSLVPYVQKYGSQMVREFYNYWTEANPNGKKMRFEMQDVFDISRRLATWHKRQKQAITKQQPTNDHVY